MWFRLFPVFVLIASQISLLGETTPFLQEKGRNALANGLWELAESHFRENLQDSTLTAPARAEISFQLAEALIRGGKAAEALELVQLSDLASQPAQAFWRGQALAGAGKLAEAIAAFSRQLIQPQAPYRIETVFSKAALLLATAQPEPALTTLALLNDDTSRETVNKSKLLQAEILTDLARPTAARAILPAEENLLPPELPFRSLLDARLLLQENQPALAADVFENLIAQPGGQSLIRYESAVLGLADALAAQQDLTAASQSLLTFIQANPRASQLAAMFDRLRRWLPAQPAASDPVLETLAQWIEPPELPALGAITAAAPEAEGASTSAFPTPFTNDERLAFSLFTRASGLHRVGNEATKAEAQRLMMRLRLENPDHPLVDLALYQLANWSLADGKKEQALYLLDTLRDAQNPANSIQADAAFLEARNAYETGDFTLAAQLFEAAASTLTGSFASVANFNAALSHLRSGDLEGFQLIFNHGQPADPELATQLELERALTTIDAAGKKMALEKFLSAHPQHPRAAEARYALIEATLSGPDPDIALVRTQIGQWQADPDLANPLPSARLDFASLRLADLSQDSAATIQLATRFLETYPNDPKVPGVTLTLGRTLFEAKDYNAARLVLEKLAHSDTDLNRAQAAWLLAARSAALVGTSASKEEALVLFDRALAHDGPLVAIAHLEKADHLITNMARTEEAAVFLGKWFKTLAPDDNLRLPAGLLLGQALYAQGASSPDSMEQALQTYDALLPFANSYPALTHRLQYLRGLVLESLPDPKDPNKNRDNQAFLAYYSVLETTAAPPEWEYFELCGFKALSLLEKAERWAAAIATAEKIASFKGPRSQEAATRATQLQLTHHIWEDISTNPAP